MNDIIDKYIESSKENLNIILLNLELNIVFSKNNVWNNNEEFKSFSKDIIDIYYDNYYLYDKNEFEKINKYIVFNNKINRKLKTILLSIINYYEKKDLLNKIKDQEETILFLTILIYTALNLYDKKLSDIDTPKKIEKVINNIIDNFVDIKFRPEKDLVSLINNIKDIVEKNSIFNKNLESLNNTNSYNSFIKINDKDEYYKVFYEYNIKELNNYDVKDLEIVDKELNIKNILYGISYDLCYFTAYKMLKIGKEDILLFNITKDNLMNEKTRKYMFNRNKLINKKIKFLLNYKDIENDYEFINMVKDNNIEIFIEINDKITTNNYNMFMGIKNIVVPEEFLTDNEKYLEIWKDMGINFIIKNLKNKMEEKELLGRK